MNLDTHKSQQGVALVTVLLVVAVITMLVASMSFDLQLDVQRTVAMKRLIQSDQYAYGLEDWAVSILQQDYEETGTLDSRREIWSQSVPPIEIPEGRLTGRMLDLDGRFNVNNLFAGGRQNTLQIERFKRLLSILGLTETIADTVLDWQDSDIAPEQNGAEDTAYQRRRPAYRTANQQIWHLSELRMIEGIDEDAYQKLKPHVIAFPVSNGPAPININTATIEIMQSLHPAITETLAIRLQQDGRAEYKNVTEFFDQPELRDVFWQNLIGTIGVDSHYFLAHGVIEIDQRVQHYSSLIEQRQSQFRIIERMRGQYE